MPYGNIFYMTYKTKQILLLAPFIPVAILGVIYGFLKISFNFGIQYVAAWVRKGTDNVLQAKAYEQFGRKAEIIADTLLQQGVNPKDLQ